MAARKKTDAPARPAEVEAAVEAIVTDPRVLWCPVRHFSPTAAWHVRKAIEAARPAAVLVEGPADADGLIRYIIDPETQPPLTLFSSLSDHDNQFGQNGVLSPSADIAVRYRGWWPLTEHAPEYVALKAGAALDAELAFCDLPLSETIAYKHLASGETQQTVDDGHLARNRYFEALRLAERRRNFDEFWNARFETEGFHASTERYFRAMLTFAWCVRNSVLDDGEAALVADGTLQREAFMRQRIDAALKTHKDRPVAVVTGAFHTVALPWTVPAKGKLAKNKNLDTMVTAHAYTALANLYGLNRLPGYNHAVWEHIEAGDETPFSHAALALLTEVMRRVRAQKASASTADAVTAWQCAQNLARLRGNREVTREDLADALEMALIKGDARLHGGVVEAAAREVLVGRRVGRVTPEAGKVPVMRDYYQQCKAFKLDVSGEAKTVRCDVGRVEGHRQKSAFLHQCAFLEVPMFTRLGEGSPNQGVPAGFFKGPDFATGENLHLLGETWGLRWSERVDEVLVDLSDRGASIAQAAAHRLRDALAEAEGDAAATTRLLLKTAQMGLVDAFDAVLVAVEAAIASDARFERLAGGLADLMLLYQYRDTLATQGNARLMATLEALFQKCALTVSGCVYAQGDQARRVLDGLHTVERAALSLDAARLDRGLWVAQLHALCETEDGQPMLRGAGYGVLFAMGATREKVVAAALTRYLRGGRDEVLKAGPFLDGLFLSAKNIFLGSARLLQCVDEVLGGLPWETFKLLLPDLRRAFTQFIPSEIDQISARVSAAVGLDAEAPVAAALDETGRATLAAAEARVAAQLDEFLGPR
ncbi:MAG: hypothetical protein JNK72_22875 [Myxococcales bacterium]|nr:hypothetical protein [Myxococcales bacterium]